MFTLNKSSPARGVFISSFLVTASNNCYSSASWLKYSLNCGCLFSPQIPVQNWLGCPNCLPSNSSARTNAENSCFQQYFNYCVDICCRRNVFNEPFPSSDRLFLVIKICCLSANIVSLFISRSLPRNGSIRHDIVLTFLKKNCLVRYYRISKQN
jgi:hypothetical protein